MSLSEEEKQERAEVRAEQKVAEKVAEQARVDAEAKVQSPDSAYTREANAEFGGESFGYGSPAPGAGPDK